MGFNSLVSSQLQRTATQAANNFAAISAGKETPKPRLSKVLQLLDRVLEQGRSMVQSLRSTNEHIESLGEAFAEVPSGLGLPAPISFQVVVHGRERKLRADLRDEIYRIGCEAIVNACRHSQAT